jgi:hypothetical protein
LKTAVILEERGILAVSGPDRRPFLQGLVSCDVDQAGPEKAVYGALLTPQGKFLFEFFVSEIGETLLLDTDLERLPDLLKRLTMYKLRSKVDLADLSDESAVAALLGAVEGLKDEAGAAVPLGDGVVYMDPRTARLGARAILPRDTLEATLAGQGYSMGAFEDYEAHRIEVGAADSRRDLQADKTLLLEANFDAFNGVSFGKGCFVGQELTARTKYRGNVRRKLFPVTLSSPAAAGTEVILGDKAVGDLRSVAGERGLAMLRIEDVDKARADGGVLKAGDAVVEVGAIQP